MSMFGLRGIFLASVVFGIILLSWFFFVSEKILPSSKRRIFHQHQIWPSLREMYESRHVRMSILAQSLAYLPLFSSIFLIQPIFEQRFQIGLTFAKWFALIAIISAFSSVINARLVMRYGMRYLIFFSFFRQILISSLILIYF